MNYNYNNANKNYKVGSLMKKFICLLISLVMVLSCFAFFGCNEKKPNNCNDKPTKQYNFVVLGDSIAEGILGASPLSEKNDYSYCGIIGQINNFNYHNRAISGYQTFQMLDYISQDGDQSAYAHITHIKNADIISISMSGNDYIYNSLNKLILEAVQNKSELRERVLTQVRTNVALIVARLKELNPNATILWQSLYNPVYWDSPLLTKSTYITLKEVYGVDEEGLYEWGKFLLGELNKVLYDYLEENPNAFVIPDVNAKFNEIYEQDHEKIKMLIYNDGIHPSNYGHSVIASVIQSKLEELGFAQKDALNSYKDLCSNRLERLYSDTAVDVPNVKTEISKSTSFDEVNEAYFVPTDEVLPNYNHPQNILSSTEGLTLVSEDTVFTLSDAYIDGGEIEDLPIMSIIDKQRSYLKLGTDGMLTLEVFINPLTYSIAKAALSEMDASTIDLAWINTYTTELFPGNSLDDVEALFKAIENTLGAKINGFDFNDENVIAIADSLSKTGKLPQKVTLPDEISFTFTQPYSLVHVDSDTQEGGFTAVYVGNYRGPEPYLIFTLSEDIWGVKTLDIRSEFMFLKIELINYGEE